MTANREYMARKRADGFEGWTHGTLNAYSRGCRCEPCEAVWVASGVPIDVYTAGCQLIVLLDRTREERLSGFGGSAYRQDRINEMTSEWLRARGEDLRLVPVPSRGQVCEGLNFPAWVSAVAS